MQKLKLSAAHLRVWMISGGFPPQAGGAEIQALRLSQALQSRNVKVHVVTFGTRGLLRDDCVDGVPVHRLNAPYIKIRNQGYFVFYTRLLALYAHLIRHIGEYDLLHVHQVFGHTSVAAWVGRRAGVPVLAKVGNSGSWLDPYALAKKKPLGSHLSSYACKNLDAIVATSQLMIEELKVWGVSPDLLHLIPNGISIPTLYSEDERMILRHQLGIGEDDWMLTFVGSLTPKKNVQVLLKAFAGLAQERHRSRLWIVGDGPLRSSLERQVAQIGIAGRVQFTGEVSNIAVAHYLAASDCFVLSSLTEGLSNALLEAMSYGLPCVATNVGGNSYLIHSKENGWLVPPAASDILQNALKYVIDNRDSGLVAGRSARNTIIAKFDIEKVADSYIALYDNLLQRYRPFHSI